MGYVRRPYGVGLLVAAVDKNGPHLYQTCPSGNIYEYYATAIGARSQSGKTYLEKHYETFVDASKENGSVAVVGRDQNFTLIEGDNLQPYLDRLELEGGNDEDHPEEGDGSNEEEKDAMET